MSVNKGKPLLKNEVLLLIDLVRNYKIINSKATNASNNLLKDEAWEKVTKEFNLRIQSKPRRKTQLRLKWENLKKSARKRSAKIKDNLKTEKGMPEYIPPNDVLDRVISMLCGGEDTVNTENGDIKNDEDSSDQNSHDDDENNDYEKQSETEICSERIIPHKKQSVIVNPKKFRFSTMHHNFVKWKQKLNIRETKSRIAKNIALTEYYILKKKMLEEEDRNIRLEHKKLKLEIEQLHKKIHK